LLLVVVPLGVLGVAVWRQSEVQRHMLVYWRASSLLMVTVYLMMDGRPSAFVAGPVALVGIPLALWYGDALFVGRRHSLGEDSVAGWFRAWRGTVTGFCVVSLPLALSGLRCVADADASVCEAWRAPPRELHAAVHPSLDLNTLGDAAAVGGGIYAAYLGASVVRGAWEASRSTASQPRTEERSGHPADLDPSA